MDISVTNVILDKTEITMTVGGPPQVLIYTIQPTTATISTVKWTSNDENVATVNQDGIVTAVGGGIAIITITTVDGDKKAHCTVTVEDASPVLSAECDIYFFKHGDKEWDIDAWTREITAVYPFGTDLSNIKPTISVSSKAIITPASDIAQNFNNWIYYTVTAENGDTKEYRAKAGLLDYVPATGVTFNGISKIEVLIDGTLRLEATVLPESASIKTKTWHSSNEAVVKINNNGEISALNEGVSTITVTTNDGNHKAYCTVMVIAP